jgi:hypothetical protein
MAVLDNTIWQGAGMPRQVAQGFSACGGKGAAQECLTAQVHNLRHDAAARLLTCLVVALRGSVGKGREQAAEWRQSGGYQPVLASLSYAPCRTIGRAGGRWRLLCAPCLPGSSRSARS